MDSGMISRDALPAKCRLTEWPINEKIPDKFYYGNFHFLLDRINWINKICINLAL
jgi:hypothetical protein